MSAPLISSRQLVAQMSGFEFTGEGLDIDVGPGEIVAIIGPDYSGKSEWLATLGGVAMPHRGELRLLDKPIGDFERDDWVRTRRELAYVRSDTSVLSAANARQNLMLPLTYHRLDRGPETLQSAIALLDELGVTDQLSLPAYLRSTQRFMIAVARALVLEPTLLLLDSPFQKLDPVAADNFQSLLLRRVEQARMSLLVVTHDTDFVLRHATRVLFVTREKLYNFSDREQLRRCDINVISNYLHKNRLAC